MMTNARATYMDASVTTASPSRLLVMLFDRLVLDVEVTFLVDDLFDFGHGATAASCYLMLTMRS